MEARAREGEAFGIARWNVFAVHISHRRILFNRIRNVSERTNEHTNKQRNNKTTMIETIELLLVHTIYQRNPFNRAPTPCTVHGAVLGRAGADNAWRVMWPNMSSMHFCTIEFGKTRTSFSHDGSEWDRVICSILHLTPSPFFQLHSIDGQKHWCILCKVNRHYFFAQQD